MDKQSRRVLILDTDPDTLITLQRVLEQAEISTTITWDETEACRLLGTAHFDLILIGDHPPEVDPAAIVYDLGFRGKNRSPNPGTNAENCRSARTTMNPAGNILRTIFLVLTMSSVVHAQQSYEKINSHFGALVSFPKSPTSQYVHTGGGVVGGVGYNLSSHHAIIGEFMWNRLGATDRALQPLRSRDIGGKSNLYVVTGNYRYEWRGKVFGTYFIGGGGLYYRTTNPSKAIDVGSGTPCTQTWLWWGFSCTSGTVTPNQSLASVGSNAFGGNGGMGITIRVGEEPYRMYFESRYHYAANQHVNTKLITVTVGVRY